MLVRIKYFIVFLSIIFLGLTQSTTYANSDSIDYEKIDLQIRQDVKNYHIPAMAIVVVDKEQVLFSKTYGNNVTIETPFIIGSMSKSFTALAIMQLVEAGKINLDSPISEYIDCSEWFIEDKNSKNITVRDLLNHTSGITQFQRFGELKSTNFYGQHVYANTNYGLLGLIIENVSGMTYEDYINENIFLPLGMKNSAASLEKSYENGLIKGYRNYFGIPIESHAEYPKEISKGTWTNVPAGYLSASASDLGKYLQMYLQGGNDIISQSSIESMFYDGVSVNQGDYFYAMGWQYSEKMFQEKMIWHAGLVENYTSSMFILPEEDKAVVVLVNTNDYLVTNNLIQNIINPLLGETRDDFKENTYLVFHGLIDLFCLLLSMISFYSLITISKWKTKQKTWFLSFIDTVRHIVIPLVLFGIPIFLETPSWVIWSFARDLWLVLYVNAIILAITGLYKLKLTFLSKPKGL
ncbi:serine hydrolase domain-containing protein [Streptococcus pacificus]|uniref:Beta-lactamase family protein n=1 Tax=Streptococcus pacificus TaxID=2740577 RepID=A0ABS0ZIM8_9STRE|nr:serine hydrolase domain-containing protein [Streptococcus pacificus]MBJ8325563.1 beta-lactamase family protein [Streptococcus pacificus]